MKVKELLEQLKKFDQEKRVILHFDNTPADFFITLTDDEKTKFYSQLYSDSDIFEDPIIDKVYDTTEGIRIFLQNNFIILNKSYMYIYLKWQELMLKKIRERITAYAFTKNDDEKNKLLSLITMDNADYLNMLDTYINKKNEIRQQYI